MATCGNHSDVVTQLLTHKPNVNALDKDGCTALTIACKEGFHEIAVALLNASAYINIQDRSGDTNLIHAVKGGHRSVVEQLLKKYADVDICGKVRYFNLRADMLILGLFNHGCLSYLNIYFCCVLYVSLKMSRVFDW